MTSFGMKASSSGRQLPLHTSQPSSLRWPSVHAPSRNAQLAKHVARSSVEGHLVPSRFPGFFDEEEESSTTPELVTPDSSSWGLNLSQMRALGITNETETRRQIDPVLLSPYESPALTLPS